MTYLMPVRQGKSTDWVKNVEAKGFMWCTPGKGRKKHRDKVLAMAILPVIDAFPIAACAGHSS
jgi:hypothetical protein